MDGAILHGTLVLCGLGRRSGWSSQGKSSVTQSLGKIDTYLPKMEKSIFASI